MKRKTFERICGVIAVFGFFLLLGTAGASDLGEIGEVELIVKASIGLALFVGGMKFGGYMV